MAEAGILIIFVLLLLLAFGELTRERSLQENQLVPQSRVREMEAAEQTLQTVRQALEVGGEATPEQIQELVRVVEQVKASVEGRSTLQAAKDALSDIARARQDIQRFAEAVAAGSAEELAKQVEAQSLALANKEGQLQYAESRLRSIGEGIGARPCWVEPDGTVIFLYDVILTGTGIRMRLRPETPVRAAALSLPLPSIDSAATLTEAEFLSATRALYDYGRRDENRCRFHVYVYDGTAATQKEWYKKLLRTVERNFYKQVDVPNGIPF
jgi:hypothetical protein